MVSSLNSLLSLLPSVSVWSRPSFDRAAEEQCGEMSDGCLFQKTSDTLGSLLVAQDIFFLTLSSQDWRGVHDPVLCTRYCQHLFSRHSHPLRYHLPVSPANLPW